MVVLLACFHTWHLVPLWYMLSLLLATAASRSVSLHVCSASGDTGNIFALEKGVEAFALCASDPSLIPFIVSPKNEGLDVKRFV